MKKTMRGIRPEGFNLRAELGVLSKASQLALGIALAANAAGCSRAPDEPGPLSSAADSRGELRGTDQAVVTTLNAFQAAMDAGAILAATTAVHVGDRVQIKTASGTSFAPISNVAPGTGAANLTRLGTDAKTGSIWSSAKVDLRDRAHIYGALRTSATVTKGTNVVIDTGTITGPVGPTVNILEAFPTLTARGTTPITITSGQDRNLQPGSYGNVTVQNGGTLRLEADYYSFANVVIETGGKIVTKTGCTPATLQARTGFTFRGTVLEDGGNDPGIGLVVRYEGTVTSNVETAFRGIILAPAAEVNLGARSHEGRFYAKTVRLQADAAVKDFVAPSYEACGAGLNPNTVVTTEPIGPAPPLTTVAELDDFLDWFMLITNAEKAEAEAKIQGVLTGSGIREAVIQRFETARQAHDPGRALMLLGLLGGMRDPAVGPFLVSLVNRAIPYTPVPNSEDSTPYDEEVGYRRLALFILNQKGGTTSKAAVTDAALHHAVPQLRSAAIKALKHGATQAELDALHAQIQPGDEFYFDLPAKSDPNFDAKLEEFRTKYSTN
jgi:hypothetical protein